MDICQLRAESRLLDAYPANAAVIDATGTIVCVNRAWESFGLENGLVHANFGIGQNYLEECFRASKRGSQGATAVRLGLQEILKGSIESFKFIYSCHSPTQRRWFELIAAPLGTAPVEGVVILHVNTTHQRQLALRFARRREKFRNQIVMCAWCRRLRNKNEWVTVENYFLQRYGFVSHGICPNCRDAVRV